MVKYRRSQIAGGTYFFTVTLRDRSATTLIDHVDHLRTAMRDTRRLRPFTIVAMVVMPDHLHALWTLPNDDSDYSSRWRAIKSRFVRAIRADGGTVRLNARREADVWQPRFWEHQIRDERDLANHIDYIHINPVKHGMVPRAIDWKWSSIHRYVRNGWLAADWAADPNDVMVRGD